MEEKGGDVVVAVVVVAVPAAVEEYVAVDKSEDGPAGCSMET